MLLSTSIPEPGIINKYVCKNTVWLCLNLNDWQAPLLSEIFGYILSEHQDTDKQMEEMIAMKILELLIHCDRLLSETELIADL
jgi:AraC family transcriptional activator of pobA